MLNIDRPDTRALYLSLRREACVTFERLGHAFERLTGSTRQQINWREASAPGLAQFRATERTLGLALPADLVACYEAGHGSIETGGWHWWPLHDVAWQARLMHTIVHGLRQGEPGRLAPEGAFTPDNRVRADAWHPGWLPIGELMATSERRLLCIDTAPGPAGRAGQLIEIEDPRFKAVRENMTCVTRWLAPGLLAYFKGLALLLERELARPGPDRMAWGEHPAQIDIGAIGRLADQEADSPALQAWHHMSEARAAQWHHCADSTAEVTLLAPTQTPARQPSQGPILDERVISVLSMRSGDEFAHLGRRLYGDDAHAVSWLHQWAASPEAGFALLLGCRGDGKTDLLLRLAEQLVAGGDPASRVPFYIDLAAWQHGAESSHVPATLSDLVGAELQRRGLEMAPAEVLQAVSDGRCLLVLDHVEAFASCTEEVWAWCQQLPLPAEHARRRRARVLLACSQEWFGSDEQFLCATSNLFRARLDRHEAVHVLGLKPVADEAAETWLAQWAPEPDSPIACACRQFLWDTRGLPAKLTALRPLLQHDSHPTPGDTSPHWFAVYAAWWRAVLPGDLGMDEQSLATHAVCIALAQAHGESGGQGITLDQHARLVAEMWPDDSAARSARRLMVTRVALCLRPEENDRVALADAHRWLAHATVGSLEQGDLDTVVLGLGRISHRATAATHTAQSWYEAGHAEPPPCLREWLRKPQPPDVAGALFQLGCSMAWQHLTVAPARADHAPVQARIERLRHAMSLALPWPLSEARLRGATLRCADLSGLPLEDLDLRDADLSDANFEASCLTRVRLDDAMAERANFSRAQLVEVSAARLRARSSIWLHARWDRRWPEADLEDAQATVPGHTPSTAESEYRLHGSPGGSPAPVHRLVASADGQWLASFGPGHLDMWRATDLALAWQLVLPPGAAGEPIDLCFSHDGDRLCASHPDAAMRYWRVSDGAYLGEVLACAPPVQQLVRAGNAPHLIGVRGTQVPCWMPDAPSQTSDMRQLWWLGSGNPCGAIVQRPQGRGFIGCTRGRFSHAGVFIVEERDGRRAVDWGSRNAWRLAAGWDSATQTEWLAVLEPDHLLVGEPTAEQPLRRIERPQAVIHGEAYLTHAALEKQRMGPRGASLAATDCLPQHTPDPQARIADLAFSPDGRWLVCVGNGQPGLALDTRTGAVQELADTVDVDCALFAPGGRSLVLAGPGLRRQAWPPAPATCPEGTHQLVNPPDSTSRK